MSQPFKQVLLSSGLNFNVGPLEITSDQVTPDCPVPWAVRKFTLRGGKQDGVEMVEIHNGSIAIRIILTRGMGILDVRSQDLRLGWDSPVTEVVHPSHINLESRGGLGWLDGFNEFIVRCGLEWFGPPGPESTHHARCQAPVNFRTLHGKIANIPASHVELLVETAAPYRLTLRGIVCERMMFGPQLDLHAAISTVPGSPTFSLHDRIVNVASEPAEFGLLYHINQGRPILEQGARLVAPIDRLTPRDPRAVADKGVANWDRYAGPTPGYGEQVYLMTLRSDKAGRTMALLHNADATAGMSIAYPTAALPCFTLWKNTIPDGDGYVTGLEPGTGYPYPRDHERRAGRVPTLKSGGVFDASIDVTVHTDGDSIKQTAAAIARLAGKRKPVIDPEPALAP
jgi:hypothetical protein